MAFHIKSSFLLFPDLDKRFCQSPHIGIKTSEASESLGASLLFFDKRIDLVGEVFELSFYVREETVFWAGLREFFGSIATVEFGDNFVDMGI